MTADAERAGTADRLALPREPNRGKEREGAGGMKLSYLPGYDVIAAANRIFGFDGWSYAITSLERYSVGEVVRINREGAETTRSQIEIVATLRVDIVIDGRTVSREDIGFGSGDDEKAHKEAITDALKRALRTFGDQFGNSLYDKDWESTAFDWWGAVSQLAQGVITSQQLAAFLDCPIAKVREQVGAWLQAHGGASLVTVEDLIAEV